MRSAPLALLLSLAGCSTSEAPALSPLAQQGKETYQNVCVACHHGDPNRDGAIGPALAGASVALLEAKVLRGEYPPGYTPRRPKAGAMPRFPELADEIPALAAYLGEVERETAE